MKQNDYMLVRSTLCAVRLFKAQPSIDLQRVYMQLIR